MRDYAIIPDIHADPLRLEASLEASGSAKLGFLGDLIDAGSAANIADDKAVLERVRSLVDSGNAVAILGNHELNACLFHHTGNDGVALRHRCEDNRKQHQSFIAAFGEGTVAARSWTQWFLTLPLWIDLGGLRLVHACWNDADIKEVSDRRGDGRLQESDLAEIADKKSPFARAVLRLVTGPEAKLPEGYSFHDINGKPRDEVRLAWWRTEACFWRDAALSVPDPTELPDKTLPDGVQTELYQASAPTVVVGHYKMDGEPVIERANFACLDYPDAPCIYRWGGETTLHQDGLMRVGPISQIISAKSKVEPGRR